MEFFHMYILLIIVVKVGFVLLAISHLYLKLKNKNDSKKDKAIVFWKDRLEYIFVLLMAILLIYLFNPRNDRSVLIDYETKILLYLFGFILLITAKWSIFFHESPLLKSIQQII